VYQSYYNLTGKPFRLSPDPEFFFPSRGHKRALAYLRYGLNQNEGFVVITGAPGTGKTTLAQILLKEMGEKNVVVAHLTTTQLDADDMLRMVAASFGLRYENLDKAALLKTIESFLLGRSREQKRALLVIDEAQNLPARSLEELRMLSNLQVGDKALLQTFLLGQAQFRQMLDHPDLEQLRQRVIANYHLSPLAADEGQRYIESRLKLVDWDNDPHFAELAFELIHEYTEGVPRRINMLCDRILLFGCMEEKHEVTSELVKLVIQELEQEISGTPLKPEAFDVLSAQPQPPVMTPVNKLPVNDKGHDKGNDKPIAKKGVDIAAALEAKPTKIPASDVVSAVEPEVAPAKPDPATALAATNQLVKNLKEMTRPEPAATSVSKADTPAPKVTKASTSEEKHAKDSIPQEEGSLLYADLLGKVDEEDELFIEITEDFHDELEGKASEGEQHEQLNSSNTADSHHDSSFDNVDAISQIDALPTKSNVDSQSADSLAAKENDEDPIKFDSKSEEKQQKTEDSEHIMGNTVKHKQPEPDKRDSREESGDTPPVTGVAQFSERELFRVIPGGKHDNAKHVSESGDAEVMAPAAHAAPSSEDVVLRRILRLVLAFHRSPSSFPGLDDPTQPLPEGVSELLELAVADDQVLTKVSPAAVMGISPVMLRAAVRFFVRRTLFVADDADHYRILGVPAGTSLTRIERHYDLLMRLLRQDKQPGATECVAKVGQAYEALTRNEDFTVVEKDKVIPEPEDKTVAVLQALENPELTIDFSEDIKPEKQSPHISTYFGQENQSLTPDPRVTRRRIHLLGQAAILGIGALVIVLGLFITQLEPTETEGTSQPTIAEEVIQKERSVASQRLGESDTSEEISLQSGAGVLNDGAIDNASEDGGARTEAIVSTPSNTPRREERDASVYGDIKSTTEFVAPVAKLSAKSPVKAAEPDTPKIGRVAKETVSSSSIEPEVDELVTAASTSPAVDLANETLTEATPSEPSQSRFKPVPVQTKSVSVAQSEVQSAANAGITVGTDVSEATDGMAKPANKFVAVPIESKSAALSSAASSQPLGNRFEGRDIPLGESGRIDPVTASAKRQGFDAESTNSRPVDPTQSEMTSVKPVQVVQVDEAAVDTLRADPVISQQALNELLTQFTEAYQAGDVTKVMSLFADKARTNDHATRAGIESDYRALFASTTSRQMAISGLSWEKDGSFARGVGEYKATIVSNNNPATNVFRGKLTLQMQQAGGDNLKITRFYFSNQIVSAEREVAPVALPVAPSQAELKTLLGDFARYYEAGDVNKLMGLFAVNARTNDRSTLSGIRQDHVDLFNSTDVRKMFLKNTKWKTAGRLASGSGGFEVMIKSKGQANFSSVTGSFAIEAEKAANGVFITQFIHKIQ